MRPRHDASGGEILARLGRFLARPNPSGVRRPVPAAPPRTLAASLPGALDASATLAAAVSQELDRLKRLAGEPPGPPYRVGHLVAVSEGNPLLIPGVGEVATRRGLRAAFSRAAPWPVLGWGTRRVALLAPGGLVVKLPVMPGSDGDNRREAAFWQGASASIAVNLAPVLAADPRGAWLVMPYAESLTWEQSEEDPAFWTVVRRVSRAGPKDLAESTQNWGVYDGRYVARDYAD